MASYSTTILVSILIVDVLSTESSTSIFYKLRDLNLSLGTHKIQSSSLIGQYTVYR